MRLVFLIPSFVALAVNAYHEIDEYDEVLMSRATRSDLARRHYEDNWIEGFSAALAARVDPAEDRVAEGKAAEVDASKPSHGRTPSRTHKSDRARETPVESEPVVPDYFGLPNGRLTDVETTCWVVNRSGEGREDRHNYRAFEKSDVVRGQIVAINKRYVCQNCAFTWDQRRPNPGHGKEFPPMIWRLKKGYHHHGRLDWSDQLIS